MSFRNLTLSLQISALMAFASAAAAEDFSFFESKIRPVLVSRCYECHSAQAGSQEGGLLLDTREGMRKGGASGRAVVPGKVDQSKLIAALRHQDVEMPPGEKLPPEVIADFVKWIESGAADPRDGDSRPPTQIDAADHWAYQPPIRPALPQVSDSGWPRDRIDYFILAQLDSAGLKPVNDADRRTLIRRAAFELTGLPPTVEEIAAFLTDPAPTDQAFARVVDRLLASPAFGIRWGRHWLDVARYAESSGYTRNMTYPLAWKYRNWVIDAFNGDLPYDQFVRQQIAGDLLDRDGHADEPIIATGFLTIGPKTLNESNILQFELNVADEQIDATFRAFMALTANCARCHDHKYDPISAKDYYALVGIFRSTKNLAAVETNVRAEHNGEYPLGPDGWRQLAAHEAHQKKVADEQKKYLELVKERNRLRDERKKQTEGKKFDDERLAAAEEKVQAQKHVVQRLRDTAPAYPSTAMGVAEADEIVDSPLFDKGNRQDPLGKVPRGAPGLLGYEAAPISHDESGRRQLADWMVDRRNPLTARVLVNRVWRALFGAGLVETVDNFGALGAAPVNQALLDDLAIRFMEKGWSIKRLIRHMTLSRAWMLGSGHDEKAFAVDPGNRLQWRFSPQPMEGEAVRDSLLAVSGQLSHSIPATSQIAKLSSAKIKKQREIGRRDFVVNDLTDDIPHRSVFLPAPRAHLPEVMTIFDAADPNGVVGARELTTLPKQALYLMNSPFVLQSAELAAQRAAANEDPVGHAFAILLGRPPTSNERALAAGFLSDQHQDREMLGQLCLVLICSGEFRTIY